MEFAYAGSTLSQCVERVKAKMPANCYQGVLPRSNWQQTERGSASRGGPILQIIEISRIPFPAPLLRVCSPALPFEFGNAPVTRLCNLLRASAM